MRNFKILAWDTVFSFPSRGLLILVVDQKQVKQELWKALSNVSFSYCYYLFWGQQCKNTTEWVWDTHKLLFGSCLACNNDVSIVLPLCRCFLQISCSLLARDGLILACQHLSKLKLQLQTAFRFMGYFRAKIKEALFHLR